MTWLLLVLTHASSHRISAATWSLQLDMPRAGVSWLDRRVLWLQL